MASTEPAFPALATFHRGHPGLTDFETSIRVEISGMDHSSEAQLFQRVRQKIEQVRRGESNLPGMAGVVAFSLPRIVFRRV